MTMRRQARGKGTLSARDAGRAPSDPYSTRPTHRLSVGRRSGGIRIAARCAGPPFFIARERWIDQWPADGQQWIEHSEGVSRLLATDGSINGRLMAGNGSSTRR